MESWSHSYCYQEDPSQFLTLSKEIADLALAREVVTELRNEGHVEEEVRGTIRFTLRGYMCGRTYMIFQSANSLT
jgi:hypothetical protein